MKPLNEKIVMQQTLRRMMQRCSILGLRQSQIAVANALDVMKDDRFEPEKERA